MNKDNDDIRKELEELEKLIDKVKQQNEEEKKKQKKKPQNTVVRINLATVYSNNFWIDMFISFLINFIVVFSLLKVFYFADVTNDLYTLYTVLIFTVIESFYRKYLLAKYVRIVLYTSGLVFSFINILLFYAIDMFVFPDQFSFINYLYPIAFVVLFQVVRAFIKNLYTRLNHYFGLKKIKGKR